MMTRYSALLSSVMGTEVAAESDPRLAGPGTVRAWEETGIAGSISRRLSSFPGLLDLYSYVRRLSSNVSMTCLVRARHPALS